MVDVQPSIVRINTPRILSLINSSIHGPSNSGQTYLAPGSVCACKSNGPASARASPNW